MEDHEWRVVLTAALEELGIELAYLAAGQIHRMFVLRQKVTKSSQ